MLSASQPPQCTAAFTGLVTWLILSYTNVYVYGDFALVMFANAYVVVFFQMKTENATDAFRLTNEIIFSYVFALIFATVIHRLSPLHPLASFPGPVLWRISTVPLAVISLQGRRHLVLDALHKQYGRFVRIGPNMLSVDSHRAFHVVYGSKNYMRKSDAYKIPGHVKGVSLFFQQSMRDHTARKRIWSRAFAPTAAQNFALTLERRTWQLIDCIEDRAGTNTGNKVDLSQLICHWSHDFMADLVFGDTNALELMKNGDPSGLIISGKRAARILDSFGHTQWLMDIIWHTSIVYPVRYSWEAIASRMLTRVQENRASAQDLTSYLLRGGSRTSLKDLQLEAIVAVQGGSDKVSDVVIVAIYFILCDPPLLKTLQTALDIAFKDPKVTLDHGILDSIPILDAVVKETLRLWSPFFLPRIVPPEGSTIEGMTIPGGTVVALAAHTQQTSEDNFSPDPHKFRAERWLPSNLGPGSITNSGSLFSFSTGPDMCIAKDLAMRAIKLCLSRLILTFDLTLPTGFDVEGFHQGLRSARTTLFSDSLTAKVTRRKT